MDVPPEKRPERALRVALSRREGSWLLLLSLANFSALGLGLDASDGERKRKSFWSFVPAGTSHSVNSLDPICGSERLSPSFRVTQQGQRPWKGWTRARIQTPLDQGGSSEGKTQKVLRSSLLEARGSGWAGDLLPDSGHTTPPGPSSASLVPLPVSATSSTVLLLSTFPFPPS